MEIIKIVSKHLDSNSYILKKDNLALIIDAGAELEDVLSACGDAIVQAILITHAHFDHIFNLDKYIDKFNVNVFLSKYSKNVLYDSSLNYGEGFKITHSLDNFTLISGDGSINAKGFDIKYLQAMGHSQCSMVYLIEENLFAGDVLFSSGIGRCDFVTGDKIQMIQTLKKIKDLKFSKVFSGHGNVSTSEEQERNINVNIRFLSRGL